MPYGYDVGLILRGTSRRIQETRTPFYLKDYFGDGAALKLFAQNPEQ